MERIARLCTIEVEGRGHVREKEGKEERGTARAGQLAMVRIAVREGIYLRGCICMYDCWARAWSVKRRYAQGSLTV
jgi:hypothetical protein